MRNIVTIFLFSFLGSCTNPNEQALSFIQKSKNKDLSILFNVSIEARGEFNNVLHYYYSHTLINKDTLTIPSFEYFDDFYKKDSATYNKTFIKLCKYKGVKEISHLIFAKKYAKKLDEIYKELGIINIKSNPNLGRFITFTLNAKCTVYYLEDSTTLKPYWKDKFRTLKKVDDKWFYECK